MSDFLDRAKAVQHRAATETRVTVHLDLLEGLIAEIERLSYEVERRRANSIADITLALQQPVTAKKLGAGE